MEVRYECRAARLVPNVKHSIVAKDEEGRIVGTYVGYWIPGLCSVSLYPDRSHPAWKSGFPDRKIKVYDGLVKCRAESKAGNAATGQAKAADEPRGETWRDRKRAMAGQETIKF